MKGERMTDLDLDKICSEFVNWEPLAICEKGTQGGFKWSWNPERQRSMEEQFPGQLAILYPPVSTDWAAAGRLMEALVADPQIEVEVYAGQKAGGPYAIRIRRNYGMWCWRYSDSFPMALCLAVAALAEASGKEAGR